MCAMFGVPPPSFFETGSLTVDLVVLELTVQIKLASNSQRFPCLCLPLPPLTLGQGLEVCATLPGFVKFLLIDVHN